VLDQPVVFLDVETTGANAVHDRITEVGLVETDRGRLVGDWFLSTLPKTYESAGPTGWTQSLAFVYDNVNPSIIRVSIGGTLPVGLWSEEIPVRRA